MTSFGPCVDSPTALRAAVMAGEFRSYSKNYASLLSDPSCSHLHLHRARCPLAGCGPADPRRSSFQERESYPSEHAAYFGHAAALQPDLVRNQETWILPEHKGFRPQRGPVEASAGAALFSEEGHTRGLLQVAVDLDLQKAFDRIPRTLIWQLAEQVAMPSHIVTAWRSWYSEEQQRFYRRNGGLGQPWVATGGFVQGCALSCIAQNLLMATLIKALKQEAQNYPRVECRQTAYADDTAWQFRAPRERAVALFRAVTAFLRVTSYWAKLGMQSFSAAKSAIWASHEHLKEEAFLLQGIKIPYVDRMSFLGAKLPNQKRDGYPRHQSHQSHCCLK